MISAAIIIIIFKSRAFFCTILGFYVSLSEKAKYTDTHEHTLDVCNAV